MYLSDKLEPLVNGRGIKRRYASFNIKAFLTHIEFSIDSNAIYSPMCLIRYAFLLIELTCQSHTNLTCFGSEFTKLNSIIVQHIQFTYEARMIANIYYQLNKAFGMYSHSSFLSFNSLALPISGYFLLSQAHYYQWKRWHVDEYVFVFPVLIFGSSKSSMK